MHFARSTRPAFTSKDLLIVVVLILALSAVLAVSLQMAREKANRQKCSSNLRALGQVLLLYCNENNGYYPRTTYTPGPSVKLVAGTGIDASSPFAPGGPEPNDVSAAIFLLLRTQEIGSEVYTCPSSGAVKDDFGGAGRTAANRSNFSDYRKDLSYSFANPYPDDSGVAGKYDLYAASISPFFATGADINPGPSGNPAALAVTTASSSRQIRQANSPNHGGKGQNVLYGDGHVDWQTTPLAGIKADNIYTNRLGQVMASPVDKDDSVLLPTKN